MVFVQTWKQMKKDELADPSLIWKLLCDGRFLSVIQHNADHKKKMVEKVRIPAIFGAEFQICIFHDWLT